MRVKNARNAGNGLSNRWASDMCKGCAKRRKALVKSVKSVAKLLKGKSNAK